MSQEQEAVIKHLEKRLGQKGTRIQNLEQQRECLIDIIVAACDRLEYLGDDVDIMRRKIATCREAIGYPEVL